MSGQDTGSRAPVSGVSPPPKGWPEPLHCDALVGLPGDIVRMIEPHTEADPAALLLQLLAAFGNVIGPNPHWLAEGATRHALNLFVVIVGDTAKGRKGTSWGQVERLLRIAAPEWLTTCISTGLSTGEGLVHRVRDPGRTRDERGRLVEDPGAADKRLLVHEPEFASVFQQIHRSKSILSMVLRNAWDGGLLENMNKNSPERATGHHVSVIGHITRDDLTENLKNADARNGFGNRMLWVGARRARKLPEGGKLNDAELAPIAQLLAARICAAPSVGLMEFDDEARQLWWSVYDELSEGGPGLFGAMTSRAEAQVRRIACLYALLAGSVVVCSEHLRAALAVWRYAEQSAAFLFEQNDGASQTRRQQRVEARLMSALGGKPDGMTKTEIRDFLNRNEPGGVVELVLADLERRGELERRADPSGPSGGRPAERWVIKRSSGGSP